MSSEGSSAALSKEMLKGRRASKRASRLKVRRRSPKYLRRREVTERIKSAISFYKAPCGLAFSHLYLSLTGTLTLGGCLKLQKAACLKPHRLIGGTILYTNCLRS